MSAPDVIQCHIIKTKGTDMRILSTTGYFNYTDSSSLKVVQEYRKKYDAISRILGENPQLLVLAHQDWCSLLSSSKNGRSSGFTSEQLLRALLVMFIEEEDYRGVVIQLSNNHFLHHFVRLAPGEVMDFTFLNRAMSTLSVATLANMHEVLNQYALEMKKINGQKQRIDTTVYETNIHYPTDSSLLWDSFRTVARLMRQLKCQVPELELLHRFHDKKVKKLFTYIGRNVSSASKATQRQVKRRYRQLIEKVNWIHGVGHEALQKARLLGYDVPELSYYLPLVAKVIDQADKRVLQGQTVPADEKLYSLFESHTELIQRGKAGKAVEFGHKILISQTKEKYIYHYQVLEKRREDKDLLDPALEAHKALFGDYPDLLATDKGFYESRDQLARLRKKIKVVSIAKKGRRTDSETAYEKSEAFVEGQRFRAGAEGSISVLKRAFNLGKCFFKGFKNYAASVGLAILCHNLVLLTQL
jgi:IS5 family transposase